MVAPDHEGPFGDSGPDPVRLGRGAGVSACPKRTLAGGLEAAGSACPSATAEGWFEPKQPAEQRAVRAPAGARVLAGLAARWGEGAQSMAPVDET